MCSSDLRRQIAAVALRPAARLIVPVQGDRRVTPVNMTIHKYRTQPLEGAVLLVERRREPAYCPLVETVRRDGGSDADDTGAWCHLDRTVKNVGKTQRHYSVFEAATAGPCRSVMAAAGGRRLVFNQVVRV